MNQHTAALLEQHFDTAFASLEGVARLRELILTLAMQGKLVEQDPSDQPASELLKDIEAEKQRLIAEKKIRKQKPLPTVTEEEIPYQLPASWEWVRLGEVSEYNGRKTLKNDEISPSVWLLDLEDIEKNTSKLLYRATFSERQSKSNKSEFKKSDVLYGKLRPYLDKVIVADDDGVCTTEIVPIVPYSGVNSYFLRWLLKRPKFISYVNSLMYGVKMPRLGTADAITSIHPLPPSAEQYRIVAKIDELMARCDTLEALHQQHAEKCLKVHSTAVQQLLEQPDSNAWDFIQKHFNELYSVPENVAELRKAILQLAVMGRLVPQDSNDPPASQLLEEIQAEKEKLIKEKKIRKQKTPPPITQEETPYELPKGWEWVRLSSIVSLLGDGIHGTPTYSDYGEYFFINGSNLLDGEISIKTNTKKVSESEYIKYKKELSDKSILVSINGTIGNVAFYNNEPVVLGKSACYFNLMGKINKTYIKKLIKSDHFLNYAFNVATGSTIKNVSLKAMREFKVPLPPIPEQNRIVKKTDQLMALCDQLDEQITARNEKQQALLDAVMAQI